MKSSPTHKIFLFLASVLLALGMFLSGDVFPGLADVAPQPNPPGINIMPDGQTKVRMIEEHVTMDLDPGDLHDPESPQYPYDYTAHVTADFLMEEMGTTAETMKTRFPFTTYDSFGGDLIYDFQVWVEGRPQQFEVGNYPDDQHPDMTYPWADFPVTYLPEQEIRIRVTYTIRSTRDSRENGLSYVFETGAGWYGTIGKAELIVNLPFEYSMESIRSMPPGGQAFGKSIRWTWLDFEPTKEDNFYISLVNPSYWKYVVDDRQLVADNPMTATLISGWGQIMLALHMGNT